ncbi:MAG: glycosyltransferase family 2 protein [Pseudomonadota bacterium]
MKGGQKVGVIIPVLDEERGIGRVISAIPEWVDDIIVVDNGSTDRTVQIARSRGARVIHEARRGYGSACLKGISSLKATDIVVFLDGDYSDYPEQMDRLIQPIIDGRADMVIGSRVLGNRDPGALASQARFGNRLSCLLIKWFWGIRYTDLGPFRAITYPSLKSLEMSDPDYGWTVEMQIKAAIKGLKAIEVPVDYRKRVGSSKVSGTLKGVVLAGTKILFIVFKSALASWFSERRPGKARPLSSN